MRFILETEQPESPVFKDVAENQFFIDYYGRLCQKVTGESYNHITDSRGKPSANNIMGCSPIMIINKILPKVKKIEF